MSGEGQAARRLSSVFICVNLRLSAVEAFLDGEGDAGEFPGGRGFGLAAVGSELERVVGKWVRPLEQALDFAVAEVQAADQECRGHGPPPRQPNGMSPECGLQFPEIRLRKRAAEP